MPEEKTVEDVRVCRFCGHIAAVDSTARCRTCGVFSDFMVVPRPAAERLARQRQRRVVRRRLVRLTVALVLLGGVTVWILGAFFDLGPSPPGPRLMVAPTSGHTPGHRVAARRRATVLPLRPRHFHTVSPGPIVPRSRSSPHRRWSSRMSTSAPAMAAPWRSLAHGPGGMGIPEWLAF